MDTVAVKGLIVYQVIIRQQPRYLYNAYASGILVCAHGGINTMVVSTHILQIGVRGLVDTILLLVPP